MTTNQPTNPKENEMNIRLTALALAPGLIASVIAAVALQPAEATPGEKHKVTICHATGAEGKWVKQNVDIASIAKQNGHAYHQGGRDIIPPFEAAGKVEAFPGLNWDADGKAIWKNGCEVPAEPGPTPTPTPTVTPEESETPEPTVTPDPDPSEDPDPSVTPSQTATSTPEPSETPEPSSTPSSTAEPTPTPSSTPTETGSVSPTPPTTTAPPATWPEPKCGDTPPEGLSDKDLRMWLSQEGVDCAHVQYPNFGNDASEGPVKPAAPSASTSQGPSTPGLPSTGANR